MILKTLGKLNKDGEQPQVQKKHNFRFDESGHIIVQNPSAYWLPNITTKQTIGGTEYIVVAEFVGDEPLHKSSNKSSRTIKNYCFKVLNFERRCVMKEMLNSTLTVAMQAGFVSARLPSSNKALKLSFRLPTAKRPPRSAQRVLIALFYDRLGCLADKARRA